MPVRAVNGNLRELEFVPGMPPETVMATAAVPVARKAVSAAEMVAVSCVALTRVVGRGDPFQLTTSPFAKPVPFTVRVRPEELQYGVLPDEVVEAESDAMAARETGNETKLDMLALDAGVTTATCAVVVTAAISAAGSVALSCAALVCVAAMYVVANGVVVPPFIHCTTEHGSRFMPLTVKVTAEAPAVAPVGERALIVGAGEDAAEIVNPSGFEKDPRLDTSIFTEPAEAVSETGIAAVSCVELTNVVARTVVTGGVPGIIQSTTELFTKFEPVTVRVAPEGLHDGVVFDEVVDDDKELMAGGAIANGICVEVPPPGVSVNT